MDDVGALQTERNKLINPLSDEPFEGQSRKPSVHYFSPCRPFIPLFLFFRESAEAPPNVRLNKFAKTYLAVHEEKGPVKKIL